MQVEDGEPLSAGDPLIEKAQQLGSSMAVVAKLGVKGMGNRLLRTRDTYRYKQALEANAVAKHIAGKTVVEKAEHIIGKYASPLELQASLNMARRVSRVESKWLKDKDSDAEAALCSFQDLYGAEKIKSLCQTLPPCQTHLMQVIPDPDLLVYDVQPWGDAKKGELLASVACAGKCNWGAALDKFWANIHGTVGAGDCNEGPLPSLAPSPCAAAGVCLCTESGKRHKSLHNYFLKVLKREFKTKERKQSLADGLIVVRFVEALDDAPSSVSASSSTACKEELFAHIAMMYWKPYQPGFHCLERLAGTSLIAGSIQVKVSNTKMNAPSTFAFDAFSATCEFKTDHLALLALSLDKRWHLEFYMLQTMCSPIHSVCPASVQLKLLVGPELLWPVPREKKQRNVRSDTTNTLHAENSVVAEWAAFVGASAADNEEDIDESKEDLPEAVEDSELDAVLAMRSLVATLDLYEEQDVAEQQGEHAREPEVVPPVPETQHERIPRSGPAMVASGPRMHAEACVRFDFGKVSYHESKGSFEAVCTYPGHKQCVLTRTSKGRLTKNGKTVSGRPVGFLAAWLLSADKYESKQEHWNKDAWQEHLDHATRKAARDQVKGLAGGDELLAMERQDIDDGEGSEPDTLEGLLR
eukprot:6459024-Amphidinium_carterae.4